jgi:hypothetical protein
MTTTTTLVKTKGDSKIPKVPVALLTASYVWYRLAKHVRSAQIPGDLRVIPDLFVSLDNVTPPRDMADGAIFFGVSGNGAFINRSGRRIQKYIISVWAVDAQYAELGGRIASKALLRYSTVERESAPEYDPERGVYLVLVSGTIPTLLSGSEKLY